MSELIVSIDIAAPIETVWAAVADLRTHAEWMADAESVEILTGPAFGVGTTMRVATKVGPFRTIDMMDIVEWEIGKAIGVRHTGLVTGEGRFMLAEVGHGTLFTWAEVLFFPWYLGGPVTGFFARPVLKWIWRRNLENLRRRIETSRDRR